jgi:hypothetical protein
MKHGLKVTKINISPPTLFRNITYAKVNYKGFAQKIKRDAVILRGLNCELE